MTLNGKTTYFDGYRNRTANVGKCECGTEFALICMAPAYACECPNCEQWYNNVGQKLKNPCEWEQEF